jgi:hypothetical protein
MPLRLFCSRNAANVVMALEVVGMFGTFFLGALYLQRVLGYSALGVGLAFLPRTLIMAVMSLRVAGPLMLRIGAGAACRSAARSVWPFWPSCLAAHQRSASRGSQYPSGAQRRYHLAYLTGTAVVAVALLTAIVVLRRPLRTWRRLRRIPVSQPRSVRCAMRH